MRHFTRILPFIAVAALAACGERPLATAPEGPELGLRGNGARALTVMSRNMYIGADVDPVLQALVGGGDVLGALQTALGQLQRTDFATRVGALADEIARARPQVVGLQEVYNLDIVPALLGLPGNPISLDFLAALQAALGARGLSYSTASVNTLTDVTLAGGAVHLVDHDVVLVDPGAVTLVGPTVENVFAFNLPLPPGSPVSVVRGYQVVPALVHGVPVVLANTHLESGRAPGLDQLRYAQAAELAIALGGAPAVIMTGDFNDWSTSPMYGVLAGAGFTDLWGAMRPGVDGFTCCHAADLSNRLASVDERIDYVWSRGMDGPSGGPQGQIVRTGVLPWERLDGAYGTIWPSDHAGLVATLVVPGHH